MLRLVLALAVALSATVANADRLILNDPGGLTMAYKAKAQRARARGEAIRIRGYCASACTIYLMKAYALNVCAERGATLRFHMPYYARMSTNGPVGIERGGEAAKIARQEWRAVYLGRFSQKLNRILEAATRQGRIPSPAAGDSNKKMFTIAADSVLPRCKRR